MVQGMVASKAPRLLEKDSQLLFCIIDHKLVLVQVRIP
jgi:hypothetical protein